MQRKVVHAVTALLLAAFLLFCFTLFLEPGSSKTARAAVLSLVSIATPSVAPGGIDWGNPVIIGALIALIGVLATAGVYMYQTHRNAKIEREKLALEREKLETQHQHEQELAKIRLQHEQDMLRLQKELELEYTAKEHEQQQDATRAEALRLKMLLDQTNSERARTYRQALHADPRISHLQILDMSRPLEVTSVYVRVRVHQGRTENKVAQMLINSFPGK